MVESGEVQLVDPNGALGRPIPALELPDAMSSDSVLQDLRRDH